MKLEELLTEFSVVALLALALSMYIRIEIPHVSALKLPGCCSVSSKLIARTLFLLFMLFVVLLPLAMLHTM